MIPQEIQNYVKQQIQASASANRFHLTGIPRHIHNGIDSPPVFQSTIIFAGKVLSSGESSIPFPTGWSSIKVSTGLYKITHNLPEGYYSISITPAGNAISPTTFTAFQVETLTGAFDVVFFDTSTQANTDTDFFITLTQINNNSTTPTQYVSS